MGGDGDTVAPSLHQNTILCREVNTVNDAVVSIGSCSGYIQGESKKNWDLKPETSLKGYTYAAKAA